MIVEIKLKKKNIIKLIDEKMNGCSINLVLGVFFLI